MNNTHHSNCTKTDNIGFNAKLFTRASVVLGAILLPMSVSYAFVDERTKSAPPELVAKPESGAQIISQTTSSASVSSVASPAQAAPNLTQGFRNLQGDFSHAAWQQAYPGPFGTMPVSDALIAHIVPVLGSAIQLHGNSAVLDRKIHIEKASSISRLENLAQIAAVNNLDISIRGAVVNLQTQKSAMPVVSTAITPAIAVQNAVEAPVTVTRTWNIPAGAMLSSALLDWAKEWGWSLIWQADVDYRISAPIVLNGDFLVTVGKVLDAYKVSPRPLWGDWNRAQKVLIVREPSNAEQ